MSSEEINNQKASDAASELKLPPNSSLVEGAGKVHLDKPQLWGKGIIRDFKECVWQHWWKEMINFNQKTVAVTLLVFITVIAPTLTFGAVYGKSTANNIGTIETMLATSWVGITYALLGGMPLCVIGSTGPVLAFTTALFDISKAVDVPFLTLYAWTSVWLVSYAFFAAFFDLTRFVRLATRFTDEIFALIIVSIFILDAVWDPFSTTGLFWYLDPNHKSHQPYEQDPDYNYLTSALLSILLGFATTWFIFFFRGFKFSEFCCNQTIRTTIHDFAVVLSVILFTVIKEVGFPTVPTESLNVPEQFEPTFKCCDASCTTQWPVDCPDEESAYGTRPWFADFGDLNGKPWVIFMAAAPAVGAFLLLYLDNGITWHLINHKSHQLQHGEAYNYDLMLSGFFNMVNGFLGLPWLVASTVPCIIHLQALAETDRHGNILSVQENRLTLLFSHLLVGLSMLFLNTLKLIPMPVLYGVFLFMGLASLPKIQFWQRLLLFIKQPGVWPSTPYTDWMAKKRIHLYTFLQLFFFALVFVVQNVKKISIVFPFMVFLCIPARLFFFPRVFEGWEMVVLDGEDEQIEEWVDAKEESIRNFEEKQRSIRMGDGSTIAIEDSQRVSSSDDSLIGDDA